jgi:RND family efflux transporter MFP subunit
MARPGDEVVMKASTAGFIARESSGAQPALGDMVAERQELGKLHVILTPQEEAQLVALKEDADILIEQSLASLAIAEDRYEQVKKLQGGTLAGNDLQALRDVVERSKAAVREAREKLPFLPEEPYKRPLQLNDMAITAPLAGRITQQHVGPGQFVVTGDPLWTVADWSTLWLKVPVFEGDLAGLDQSSEVEVLPPGAREPMPARPTGVPRPTEEGRRTVDLFYEISNQKMHLRPGQAVSVAIPTGANSPRIVIPQSALLWDGMGDCWVYVRQDAETFRRQRVRVGPFLKNGVTIERGLDEQEEVVVVGAEALYGEEFSSQPGAGEDD